MFSKNALAETCSVNPPVQITIRNTALRWADADQLSFSSCPGDGNETNGWPVPSSPERGGLSGRHRHWLAYATRDTTDVSFHSA